jgi:hypothetical protein
MGGCSIAEGTSFEKVKGGMYLVHLVRIGITWISRDFGLNGDFL